MKKALVALIVVIAVLAVGLVAFMVMGITGGMPGGFGFLNARVELANRQTFPASQLRALSMRYSLEEITLLPADGDDIVLEEYFSSWDEGMKAQVETQGDRLNIRQGNRPNLFGLFSWRGEIKLYLPDSWQGELELESRSGTIVSESELNLQALEAKASSGSIRMSTVRAVGDIALTCTSGSVRAERLQAGGEVQMNTTSGSVRAGTVEAAAITAEANSGSVHFEQATAGTVEAGTTSGGLRFERLDGQFKLKSSSGGVKVEAGAGFGTASATSGSVEVRLDSLEGDVSLKASSGSCKLYVPPGSAFTFSARVSSGGIHTPDDGALSYNQKGNEAQGSFGSAPPTHNVEMEATSGSVRLNWN